MEGISKEGGSLPLPSLRRQSLIKNMPSPQGYGEREVSILAFFHHYRKTNNQVQEGTETIATKTPKQSPEAAVAGGEGEASLDQGEFCMVTASTKQCLEPYGFNSASLNNHTTFLR
jgi:hypothetical protein